MMSLVICLLLGLSPAAANDRQALPNEPALRSWVLEVEPVFEPILEIGYLSYLPERWRSPEDVDRLITLAAQVDAALPEWDILRRATLLKVAQRLKDQRPDVSEELAMACGAKVVREWLILSFPERADSPFPLWTPPLPGPEGILEYLAQFRRARTLWPQRDLETQSERFSSLPRLGRVLSLYFDLRHHWPGGPASCGVIPSFPPELESDWRVVALKATAQAFPDRLAAAYRWLSRDPTLYELGAIGFGGPSRNSTRLLSELLEAAPEALPELRELFRVDHPHPGTPQFQAMRAYLRDGAPLIRDETKLLVRKLRGNSDERLWAAAWLHEPRKEPAPLDPRIEAVLLKLRGRPCDHFEPLRGGAQDHLVRMALRQFDQEQVGKR
ncbi:MAG: hypothetical protein RL885_24440 [Planctomycetota bacterium]